MIQTAASGLLVLSLILLQGTETSHFPLLNSAGLERGAISNRQDGSTALSPQEIHQTAAGGAAWELETNVDSSRRVSTTFGRGRNQEREPDPDGRIVRDRGEFVVVEAISDPRNPAHGSTIHFRVILSPTTQKRAHWNDSAGDIKFWIDWPKGWTARRYHLLDSNPSQSASREIRQIAFEARPPESDGSEAITIRGYAVYFICEEIHSTCMLRRQDFSFRISSK